MTFSENFWRHAAADYVFDIAVTDGAVSIVCLKARDKNHSDFALASNDPRLLSLQAAFHRFIEGDAA